MHIKSPLVLVVGGAGYIGSHMMLTLKQNGFTPVALDNLSHGHAHAVGDAELIVGDVANSNLLNQIFAAYDFVAVMHFASLIDIAESVKYPGKYYRNNVAGMLPLLDCMIKNKVQNIIFSSSAAVYGEPQITPINENHSLKPLNPYGRSKWMVEEIIKDHAQQNSLRYAILRYFNAAGADPDGRLGERHVKETHLIPIALQVAAEHQEHVLIYGNDYATSDGTCIRDYVHVSDICDAHMLALQALLAHKPTLLYNVGSGHGYSVQEVLEATERVTGKNLTKIITNRRAGDVAVLVADASLIKRELNWQPRFYDLDIIIKHAWQYMQNMFSI